MSLQSMPVELLSEVGSLLPQRDIHTFIQVNHFIRDVLTPALYRTLVLTDYPTAFKCVRTLSSPASATSSTSPAHSNPPCLPSFVRYMIVSFQDRWRMMPQHSPNQFLTHLATSLAGMTTLRVFVCDVDGLCSPAIWTALVKGPRSSLRSLNILVPLPAQWADGADPDDFATLIPEFPNLDFLEVRVAADVPSAVQDFVVRVFRTNASHLYLASLLSRDTIGESVLIEPMPVLEEIEIDAHSLSLPVFDCSPAIRYLTVQRSTYDHFNGILHPPSDLPDFYTIHPSAFPALTYLSCPTDILHLFMSPAVSIPRPVRRVRLNGAEFDQSLVERLSSNDVLALPSWPEVLSALSNIQYSAAPVVELAFLVERMDLRGLPSLLPFLAKLESLTISVYDGLEDIECLPSIGASFVAHLPKLHTLLLSDALHDVSLCVTFARHAQLQRDALAEFSRHSKVLKRVAFATEFEWRRHGDAWEAIQPSLRGTVFMIHDV